MLVRALTCANDRLLRSRICRKRFTHRLLTKLPILSGKTGVLYCMAWRHATDRPAAELQSAGRRSGERRAAMPMRDRKRVNHLIPPTACREPVARRSPLVALVLRPMLE